MTTSTVRELSPFALAVAGNIRAEAARAGYRQLHLAKALGMSQPAASERWRGLTPWTLGEVEAVAGVLGVDLDRLLVRHQGLEPRTRWLGVWRARHLRSERAAEAVAGLVSLGLLGAAAWQGLGL